jgi:hypothetical protein
MECIWNFDIMMIKIWYAGKVITDASEAIVSTNLAQCCLQGHYQLQQWENKREDCFQPSVYHLEVSEMGVFTF